MTKVSSEKIKITEVNNCISSNHNLNPMTEQNMENRRLFSNNPLKPIFSLHHNKMDNKHVIHNDNSYSYFLDHTDKLKGKVSSTLQLTSSSNNKTNFFSRKTMTLNKVKVQPPPKEEIDPKEWFQSIYRAEVTTSYGRGLLKIQYADYIIITLSFLSIIFALIDNELYIANNQNYLDAFFNNEQIKLNEMTIDHFNPIISRKLTMNENIIRSINTTISILLSLVIIGKYHFQIQLQKLQDASSKYENIFSRNQMKSLIPEAILGLIFFPPNVHAVYHVDEGNVNLLFSLNTLFNALTVFKIIFVLRITKYCSRWDNSVGQSITKNFRVQNGNVFSFKCQLKKRPLLILSVIWVMFILFIGLVTRSYEYTSISKEIGLVGRKGINDMRNLFNCFWLIIVTMMSIGYGDYTPRTTTGRILVFASSVFGVLLMCLLIVTMNSYSELTHDQTKAYLKIKKLSHRDNKQHKAGNVIRLLLCLKRLYLLNINDKTHRYYNEAFALFSLLITHIKLMKNNDKVSNSYAIPITDILKSINEKVTENISSFTKGIEDLNEIETDLNKIEECQKVCDISLCNVCNMQSEILMYLFDQFNQLYVAKKKKRMRMMSSTVKIKKPFGTIIMTKPDSNPLNEFRSLSPKKPIRNKSFKKHHDTLKDEQEEEENHVLNKNLNSDSTIVLPQSNSIASKT